VLDSGLTPSREGLCQDFLSEDIKLIIHIQVGKIIISLESLGKYPPKFVNQIGEKYLFRAFIDIWDNYTVCG
jgi:hypothetical protein